MRKSILICLMAWYLMGGMTMVGQTKQNAQGKLTVNGKTTELHYAYARQRQNLYDENVREVRVVLSDVPIADADMEDDFAVHELGVQGKVHAVDIRFSLEGEPQGGSLYDEAAGDAAVTEQGHDKFERKQFDDKTVAGKVSLDEPVAVGDLTYDFSATFSAAVQHESEGAAAAATGPGKAVLEYLRAIRAADKPALKKICTEASYQQIESVPPEQLKAMAAEMIPADTHIVRVFESGDRARVETDSKSGETKLKLLRINGEWKLQL